MLRRITDWMFEGTSPRACWCFIRNRLSPARRRELHEASLELANDFGVPLQDVADIMENTIAALDAVDPETTSAQDILAVASAGLSQLTTNSIDNGLIEECVLSLQEPHRSIFLSFQSNMPQTEIAHLTGLTVAEVSKSLVQSYATLRTQCI